MPDGRAGDLFHYEQEPGVVALYQEPGVDEGTPGFGGKHDGRQPPRQAAHDDCANGKGDSAATNPLFAILVQMGLLLIPHAQRLKDAAACGSDHHG